MRQTSRHTYIHTYIHMIILHAYIVQVANHVRSVLHRLIFTLIYDILPHCILTSLHTELLRFHLPFPYFLHLSFSSSLVPPSSLIYPSSSLFPSPSSILHPFLIPTSSFFLPSFFPSATIPRQPPRPAPSLSLSGASSGTCHTGRSPLRHTFR